MDKDLLVDRIKWAFNSAREAKGIVINAFSLAPGWEGLVPDSYMLVVLAPSLAHKKKAEKIKIIFDILYEYLSQPERRMISTVRVFDDSSIFIEKSRSEFDDREEENYYRQKQESEIFELY
jgi:hypothetical protein